MDIGVMLYSCRVAKNDDIPVIVSLANQDPEQVLIRDMRNEQVVPLAKIARSPFLYILKDGFYIMYGYDLITRKSACMRIVATHAGDVVELLLPQRTAWVRPAEGKVRIYIPRGLLP